MRDRGCGGVGVGGQQGSWNHWDLEGLLGIPKGHGRRVEGWETPPSWSVSKLKCFSPCISLPPSSARLHRWNQLDLAIVLLSVMGITLEEIEINAALPINPTIIRIMRVLRIARGEGRVGQDGPPAERVE